MNIFWLLNIFLGIYYIVVIFEIGLVIVVICFVFNFYYSKIKMFGWLKMIFFRILVFFVRVKVKRRWFLVKESLWLIDGGYVFDIIYNLMFEIFNYLDNGLVLIWVGDVFE